jgi:hypothetical protein
MQPCHNLLLFLVYMNYFSEIVYGFAVQVR